MEQLLTISSVLGVLAMAAGAGFGFARREFAKAHNDNRMEQALRRTLGTTGTACAELRVIQWQSCDAGSLRFS